LAIEAIQANSGAGLPPQQAVNSARQGQDKDSVEKADARQRSSTAETNSDPPVDKVEVSVAARELAKTVADDKPHLQLSADRLSVMATGDSNVET
jgi:hypothetical protein